MSKDNIEIIYEDSDIIAINKPAGISDTHDRSGKVNLINYLHNQRKDQQSLKIVHRLDKDTSDIMLLAKNTSAQRKLSEYFEKGRLKKIYLALIIGSSAETIGVIDAPIVQSRKNPQIMEVDLKKGKEARTKWELVADFGSISLIAARPITGRTHQIRVHLQYAGMPLAIDPLYGQNQAIMLSSFKADYKLGKYEEEKPLIDRLTLCAYELEIENLHPVRDKASLMPDGRLWRPVSNGIHLIAPLEKKFKAAIKMLTKYNARGPAAFIKEQNFNRLLDSQPLLLQI
jgi:RluA family pseudouridine synthase